MSSVGEEEMMSVVDVVAYDCVLEVCLVMSKPSFWMGSKSMEEVCDEDVFYVGRCWARNVLFIVSEHVLLG